jgi:transcriptional regulator with GAF, ATPase, and Fis domain
VLAAASRLSRDGGDLVIRAPSARVVRLFELADVGTVLRVEPDASSGPDRRDEDALTGALRTVAAVPAGIDVVDATLTAVVVLAAATIAPVAGASLTLRRHGRLVTAAATDETVRDLDQHQYDIGQGPCVDAATHGQRFHLDSRDDQRWTSFTARAIEHGFYSVLSTPLVTPTGPVGALNLYAESTGAFDTDEHELASLFAAQASAVLGHAAVELTFTQIAARLHAALRAREVIAQAQGALMAQTGATSDEAHTILRKRSQMTGSPLAEQARVVTSETQGPSRG